jgi:hypothetical protein
MAPDTMANDNPPQRVNESGGQRASGVRWAASAVASGRSPYARASDGPQLRVVNDAPGRSRTPILQTTVRRSSCHPLRGGQTLTTRTRAL